MIQSKEPLSDEKNLRVVLVGGGTSGGHIMPLLAVGQELQRQGADLLWIGDEPSRARELAQTAGIPFVAIPSGKLHRYFSLENLKIPFRYWAGRRAARKALTRFAPDVVFAKGGAVSLPTVMTAYELGIPVVIHESDAVMGLANRRSIKYAARVCVAYPAKNYVDVPSEKIVVTGVPVREDFFTAKPMDHARPVVLVTGGGQGSIGINRLIFAILPQLTGLADIVHLTGFNSIDQARNYKFTGYQPMAYASDDMTQLVANADLVITRASATTLAELAAASKPTVLIPLPSSVAANDHQRLNAEVWREAGAAIVCEQENLTPQELAGVVTDLINDPAKLAKMARAAHSLADPKATKKIVEQIRAVRS